jgi:circadian clock protein KaiB
VAVYGWHQSRKCGPAGSSVLPVPTRQRRAEKEGLLSQYILKLYVTGRTSKAEVAIANLRRICDEDLRGEYELEIIDVLEQPQAAEDDKILATPTLLKQLPPPLRRVIGDLSDKQKVLLGLEVRPGAATPTTDR